MKIVHISDLHFHESTDGNAGKYRHSLACLKDIEKLLGEHTPTHLIVTGDITNIGDKLNLERAYQWLHDQIYSDGEYYGLHTVKRGLTTLIVPGNHDAFNAPTTGSDFKRWQSSLSNFYSVFHQYSWKEAENGVMYRWHEDDNVAVLFCSVDSCYLGDPETEHLGGTLSLARVAKGRLSRRQSESILSLFDKGMSGELETPNAEKIPSGRFLSALKVLVMHHYLFEPANARAVHPNFTQRQGQYLTFIHYYTKLNRRPPSEADIQRYFGVSPPTVHQMIITLDGAGHLARVPGQARSLRVLTPPEHLPHLE